LTIEAINVFGFSRGAYTVRALAGMIHMLGLVRPEHDNLATLAWAIYANEAHVYQVAPRFQGGRRFRRCFGVAAQPDIHFVGVWDMVSSFGFFWDFQALPYTSHNPSVQHFRHALALDERRTCFPANMFCPAEGQVDRCKQVWFAGVHADVGGGYAEPESALAKIPLSWMLREAVIADTDVQDIQSAISACMKEGLGIGAIATRIRQVSELTVFRAATVARADTHLAATFGSVQSVCQVEHDLGITMFKAWLPTMDDRTRDDHRAVASVDAIPLNEEFNVGGSLMDPPGNPSAPASR
jgi:uncharacterized protein (DUF2235 family)